MCFIATNHVKINESELVNNVKKEFLEVINMELQKGKYYVTKVRKVGDAHHIHYKGKDYGLVEIFCPSSNTTRNWDLHFTWEHNEWGSGPYKGPYSFERVISAEGLSKLYKNQNYEAKGSIIQVKDWVVWSDDPIGDREAILEFLGIAFSFVISIFFVSPLIGTFFPSFLGVLMLAAYIILGFMTTLILGFHVSDRKWEREVVTYLTT